MNNDFDLDIVYSSAGTLAADMGQIIEQSQRAAYRAVNIALVYRNWLLGRRIAEEELKGGSRAEYGKQQMQELSAILSAKYGKGFDPVNLCWYTRFFKQFTIFDTLCKKSKAILSWSHYRVALQAQSQVAIDWYLNEACNEGWGVRTLQRNISSQYYERTLLSQSKEAVREEMVELTKPLQDKLEFIKNPVIAAARTTTRRSASCSAPIPTMTLPAARFCTATNNSSPPSTVSVFRLMPNSRPRSKRKSRFSSSSISHHRMGGVADERRTLI